MYSNVTRASEHRSLHSRDTALGYVCECMSLRTIADVDVDNLRCAEDTPDHMIVPSNTSLAILIARTHQARYY